MSENNYIFTERQRFIPRSLTILAFIIPLLYFIELETKITKDTIYVKLFPFHWNYIEIPFSEIKKFEARKYRPIIEYGGWGLRWGFKNGKAYNIKGNMGLQLEFNNGKKLLIGTQKPDELTNALKLWIQ